MSNYAIMRFQKYKVGSVANIERHQNHRERLYNRKHIERENENKTWKRYDESMTQTIRKAMKEQEKKTGRKVRKDANVLCELVLTFSPEMEDEINLPEWIKANFAWVRDTFGKGKMIRADLNRDETTTHLHCFVIMTDDDGKFNSSRFFNKKSQIVEMQDSYAERMTPFGLVRGESKEVTNARHQTLQEWKKEECERIESELIEMVDNVLSEKEEPSKDEYIFESEIFDELR